MSDWRQKLKETFQIQTGLDLSEEHEPIFKVSTMERVLDAQMAEAGANWPEPEDSLVSRMLFKRPEALFKKDFVMVRKKKDPKVITAEPKLHAMALKILLASIPGKPREDDEGRSVRLGPNYGHFDGISLTGPWSIKPVTRELAKVLGYRFIESISKIMGVNHMNRPHTRSLVEQGQHLIVVETEGGYQIWAPPIAE